MGLIASLFNRPPKVELPSEIYRPLVVDLTNFQFDGLALGEPPAPDRFFFNLIHNKTFLDEPNGLTLEFSERRLECIYIELTRFPGGFTYLGNPISLTTGTTLADVQSTFGEPYWLDDDVDETILFYEDGTTELQFEFPDKQHLGVITVMLNPIMAQEDQRKAYGVDKPWPPAIHQ